MIIVLLLTLFPATFVAASLPQQQRTPLPHSSSSLHSRNNNHRAAAADSHSFLRGSSPDVLRDTQDEIAKLRQELQESVQESVRKMDRVQHLLNQQMDGLQAHAAIAETTPQQQIPLQQQQQRISRTKPRMDAAERSRMSFNYRQAAHHVVLEEEEEHEPALTPADEQEQEARNERLTGGRARSRTNHEDLTNPVPRSPDASSSLSLSSSSSSYMEYWTPEDNDKIMRTLSDNWDLMAVALLATLAVYGSRLRQVCGKLLVRTKLPRRSV